VTDAQKPIRIVIADDHPIFREGLRRLLEAEPGLIVVGQAGDGDEALQQVQKLRPDVLLLDLAMPKMGGLDVLRELNDQRSTVRTVLLTAAVEREEAVQALASGAYGVVLKESATQLLYKCVRAVASGEYWIGRDRVADILKSVAEENRKPQTPAPASQLTKRELQLVAAIVGGSSNKDIAQELSLSEQTVKNHLSNIFDKVGVSNRLELALYALHHRLLKQGA
jgi:two-component system nitrate/nitrite response regulator NarL